MLSRMFVLAVFLIAVLAVPCVGFAEYKVVVKKNGKILEGKLLREDETSVTIINGGVQLRFKKDELDLNRMKELNTDYKGAGDVKTVQVPEKTATKGTKTGKVDLGELAKQSRETREEENVPSSINEKILVNRIKDLEDQRKIKDTQGLQFDISKAKRALSHSRSAQQLSVADRKFMLEEVIKALEADLDKKNQIENSAEEEREALKKQIDQKKDELTKINDQ